MSGSTKQQPSITAKEDAALSLCVLSGGGSSRDVHRLVSPTPTDATLPPTLSPTSTATMALPKLVGDESTPIINLMQDFQAADSTNSAQVLDSTKAESTKALLTPSKKQVKRGTYNKRAHPVSFDEMKRLMRVYGPIKCLRNRNSPARPGSKDTSIKRKFYRWFPDFNERFEITEGGWFMPKFGHEHEMKYREAMRKSDQQVLIKKRCLKRCGSKSFENPATTTANIPL